MLMLLKYISNTMSDYITSVLIILICMIIISNANFALMKYSICMEYEVKVTFFKHVSYYYSKNQKIEPSS